LNLDNSLIKDQATDNKKSWLCPCNGCKKARKQAFAEVFQIADGGGDAYTKIANIKKLVQEK
jgi:hypothetical protein